jgi:DNA end-binding protein Ku
MAAQLVAAMTGEFDPGQYRDEYREAVQRIIEAKVEGKETVEVAEPEPTGKLIDLMAALEASVSAAKAARQEAPVSVSEAKQRKAATAKAKGSAKAVEGAEPEEAEAAQEARPARRRKTA